MDRVSEGMDATATDRDGLRSVAFSKGETMLWLRRKRYESIVVNDGEIEIVVGRIDGDTVRIGIEAPQSCAIMRGEVWLARERAQSSVVSKVEETKEGAEA